MGVLILDKRYDKPVQRKWVSPFFFSACSCLASSHAYEHHNSERLIQEKTEVGEQLGFWRGQSYSKDDAIRTGDQWIFKETKTTAPTDTEANAGPSTPRFALRSG